MKSQKLNPAIARAGAVGQKITAAVRAVLLSQREPLVIDALRKWEEAQ